jgi:hypothetical protein
MFFFIHFIFLFPNIIYMADNIINQVGETIQNVGNKSGDVLFNQVGLAQLGSVSTIPGMIAKLFLVMYAAAIAPRLSHKLMPLVDNVLFKILFFSVLLYLGNTDPVLAILMATVFVLTITFGRKMQGKEKFENSDAGSMDKGIFEMLRRQARPAPTGLRDLRGQDRGRFWF